MHRLDQLQFQQLPPDAQRAALWRLALSGLGTEQIVERTGWSAEEIRRAMHDGPAPSDPPWRPSRSRPFGVHAIPHIGGYQNTQR